MSNDTDSAKFKLPGYATMGKMENEEGDYLYVVAPENRVEVCSACGAIGGMHIHRSVDLNIRDLPISGHRVGILIKSHRYRCRHCQQTCGDELPLIDGKMTERLKAKITEEAFFRSFHEVAVDYSVSESIVKQLMEAEALRRDGEYVFECPEVLGIDEVHLHRHSEFQGVFVKVDPEDGAILEMSESRSKEAVKMMLRRMAHPERLKAVTMDMWPAYRTAVEEVFPGIPIVVDRFHVVKALTECMDTERSHLGTEIRSVAKKATNQVDKAQLQKQAVSLKNIALLMRMDGATLTAQQHKRLHDALNAYPKLKTLYEIKEAGRMIYEVADTEERARELYEEWKAEVKASGLNAFDSFISTVKKWDKEIFAYFSLRITNGQTEGFNRRIKDIAREGRGYSFRTLRAKVLFGRMPINEKFNFDSFNKGSIKSPANRKKYTREIKDAASIV
mgnify:FL=1